MLAKISNGKVFRVSFVHEGKCTFADCQIGEEKSQKIEWPEVTTMIPVRWKKGDEFSRLAGKKAALTKALVFMKISREDRKKIWEVFLTKFTVQKKEEKIAKISSLLKKESLEFVDAILFQLEREGSY